MRIWYIIFFTAFIYSVSLQDIRNGFKRKNSQEFLINQDLMQLYLKHCAAHANLLKNQKPEPKKNEELRRLEIHTVALLILQDL